MSFGWKTLYLQINYMKKKIVIAFLFGMMNIGQLAAQSQLAFPGAEGFGRFATGGRNGSVYHVTNLNDSGTGSFRDAVSKSNRIVVFDVAGVIRINSRIVVSSNIYIAGQTAPGEGITIYGNGFSFSGADNTICRYLRIRMGAVGDSGKDALGIANGSNMIFDHCSIAWGRDETFSISGDNPNNITIQNCIISQGLLGHSAGGLIQTENVSIYRTLYIHNDTRNPKFKGRHQYVNNIVYNWKSAAYIMGGDSEGTSYANATGNLFITGTSGKKNAFSGANSKYNIYANDNLIDDNQDGRFNPRTIQNSEFEGGPTFKSTPFSYPDLPQIAAKDLFEDLLPTVGASLPYRDNLDWMLISDVRSLGKEGDIISHEDQNDIGAPNTWTMFRGTKIQDTDKDGMPDWWEEQNGTDPNVDDAMKKADNGYVNIENYINSITADQSEYFLKAPLGLKATDAQEECLTLSWRDFTDHEDGYVVEQLIDGSYTQIGITNVNQNKFTVKGLTPQTSYSFRVKAFVGQDEFSNYSNVLTVSTKAKLVEVVNPNDFEADVVWSGNTSMEWNTSDANWIGKNNESVNVNDNENVLFDDQGNAGTINIPSPVSPKAVMVKGSKDYFLNGVIAGDGSVNMAGSGNLTLAPENTFSGGVVVWGGNLNISQLNNYGLPSSIGTAATWVWNGGRINYTGTSTSSNREVALQRTSEISVENASAVLTLTSPINGDGDLIKTGPGTLKQNLGLHTYTGNTIVRGGTYEIVGKDATGSASFLNGKLILEGGRFKTSGGDKDLEATIQGFDVEVNGDDMSYFDIVQRNTIKNKFSGSGNLTLEIEFVREFYSGNWDNFYGNVTAKQKGSGGNQFYLYNSGGMPNARLRLEGNLEMRGNNGKTVSIGGLSGTSSTTLACCYIKKDGGVITWKVGGLGTDETFAGKITDGIEHSSRIGTTNIIKEGEGIWRINGACKYRGKTDINEGTFLMNGAHSKDVDHTSTSFTPGNYTVANGATLGGKGSTEAAVVVKSGGTLSPGDGGIGTFTAKNGVNFYSGSVYNVEINRMTRTSDKLAVTGKLTFNGTLNLTLLKGEYAEGDVITVFSASSYTGSCKGIYPEIPAEGLEWDLSELLTTGKIKVVSSQETGISNPSSQDSEVLDSQSYNISGQPVSPSHKGIIIKGNKKYLK